VRPQQESSSSGPPIRPASPGDRETKTAPEATVPTSGIDRTVEGRAPGRRGILGLRSTTTSRALPSPCHLGQQSAPPLTDGIGRARSRSAREPIWSTRSRHPPPAPAGDLERELCRARSGAGPENRSRSSSPSQRGRCFELDPRLASVEAREVEEIRVGELLQPRRPCFTRLVTEPALVSPSSSSLASSSRKPPSGRVRAEIVRRVGDEFAPRTIERGG